MLGVNDFGIYTLAFGFVTLFGGLSDLGIHTLTIKEVSRDKNLLHKYLSNNLILLLILSAAFYLVLLLVLKIMNYPAEVFTLISTLGIIIFANYLINAFSAVLNSLERMEISALISFLQYVITPLAAITLLLLNFSLKSIFVAIAGGNIALAIIFALIVNAKFIKLKWKVDVKFWRQIIKNSIPFAVFSMLWLVYIQNGPIILSKIQSIESVGIYNAPNKLILALLFIPGSVSMAIFPLFSRLSKKLDNSKLKESCEGAIKALVLLALPLAIGITLLAEPMISLIYGQEFIASSTVFIILGWALLFIFIDNPLTLVAINSDKFRKYLIYLLGITAFNVVLNIVLGIKLDYLGIAFALLITGVAKVLILLWFLRKKIDVKPNLINVFKKTAPMAIMLGLAIAIMNYFGLHLVLIIISSMALYLLLMLLLKEPVLFLLLRGIFKR